MAGPGGIIENLGMLRLTAFGPGPLRTKVPAGKGPAEFELEFMLQVNMAALNTTVLMLRDRLEHAKRASPAARQG
jgi:hypothetical protein